MTAAPVVSVVVPCLNEEDSLPAVHRRVREALDGIEHEIVFVDDGSTDASRDVISAFAEQEPGS